jgi:hypothetical protein
MHGFQPEKRPTKEEKSPPATRCMHRTRLTVENSYPLWLVSDMDAWGQLPKKDIHPCLPCPLPPFNLVSVCSVSQLMEPRNRQTPFLTLVPSPRLFSLSFLDPTADNYSLRKLNFPFLILIDTSCLPALLLDQPAPLRSGDLYPFFCSLLG